MVLMVIITVTMVTAMSPYEALLEAIRLAGSLTALGRICGVTQQAVRKWKMVPAGRVLPVAAATGIPPHILRPDIYPIEQFPASAPVNHVLPRHAEARQSQGAMA